MSSNEILKLHEALESNAIQKENATLVYKNDIGNAPPSNKKAFTNNQSIKSYVISDIIGLIIGFTIAYLLTFAVNNVFSGSSVLFLSKIYTIEKILTLSLFFVCISLYFAHTGHYRLRMPFWIEAKNITSTLGFALLVDGFLQFASKQDVSRLLIISGWFFSIFTIIGMRAIVKKSLIKHGNFQIPAIIIGSGTTAQQALAAIKSAPEMGYDIVAQIKSLTEAFLQSGRSWSNLCEKYGAQHVIIALDGQDFIGTETIIAKLMRESIPYSVSPPMNNLPVAGMTPQYFLNHNTMLLTRDSALAQALPQMAKRALDVIVSGVALILSSPVMLVVAALVKLDGGSALFGHNRIGRDGKIFPCLKFRSMVMGGDKILAEHLAENPEAAAEWKASQKLQNDPRVTKIGKFLRSTSLDELPQLINVLRGDMSLVGPRPIVRDEVAHYSHDIAHYYRVRPGVTGLWQVSGRSDVSYAQRVQMDSWYVRNWSLWHDIAILFKTVPAVFKRSGAY